MQTSRTGSLAANGSVFVVFDGEGQVVTHTDGSDEILEKLGVSAGGGSTLLDSGMPVLRDVVRGALLEQDGASSDVEIDGAIYELRARGLSPATGGARALLAIREVSFERKLEERCLVLEKFDSFDRLIPSVVHDVRNPLTSASTLIETVQLVSQLDPKASKRLKDAVKQLDRAIDLLKSFSSFSRNQSPTFYPYPLNRMIEETVALHRCGLSARNIVVKLRLDETLPQVYADPSQLKQIVANLMTNAADAVESTGNSGSITLTTTARLGVVRLIVEDDGPGVPADVAQRIFAPFFTTKSAERGSGLGLAISAGIARAHGGHLWLKPRKPRGACFILDLPDPRSIVPAKDRAFLGVSQSKQPISLALVIEPNPRQLEVASLMLRRDRYTVHVATSGAKALTKLKAMEFQFVLCAWELGDVAGHELLRQALKQNPSLACRLAISTENPDDPELQRFTALHGIPSLKRPYGAQELKELLEALTAVA